MPKKDLEETVKDRGKSTFYRVDNGMCGKDDLKFFLSPEVRGTSTG